MRWLLAGMAVVMAGCAHKARAPLPPAPTFRGPSFVELQPGWRVRVITPVLKSGGFILKTEEQQEQGNTITLRMGDEFLGYETAIYSVGKHKRGGVEIALTEVAMNRSGQLTHAAKSIAPRIRKPDRLRHVRLLYTLRVSDADHNMAVLAAADSQRLAALTQRVQASPATACVNNRNEYCEWVPAGVAMRAEKPNGTGWAPAN
ncbi:MAG: hypothetical protein HYX27_20650 [Acidobacteria bacterium]|nr:hypothetical protein [Acidobacteriota bacterium]